MNRRSISHLRDDERGVFVILLAGILISMLLILGMAVDSGTLYNGQLSTQAAADAAAASGAALLAEQGSLANRSQIEAAMVEMARTNLKEKGIEGPAILQLSAQCDVGAGTAHVSITSNMNLRILRVVPGFRQASSVNATARAHVRPAVVSLLLDTSFSMCCKPGEVTCNLTPNCPIAGTKLADLQTAVISFISHFDPAHDNINLVAYALGAELLVPFQAFGTGFPKDVIEQQVLNLTAGGATNFSDPILRAYFDVQNIGAEKQAAYVFFSDGAPTAARFLLADLGTVPKSNSINNILGLGFTDFDYLSWAEYTGTSGSLQSIPYYFVYTPKASDWNARLHTDSLPPPNGIVIHRGPMPPHDGGELFSWTLRSMSTYMPDGSIDPGPTPIDPATGQAHWEFFNYRQEYFNYALRLADFARQKGGSWYAVGLGDPAPQLIDPSTGLTDPYQNADRDFDRKDIYLGRLANDACGYVRGDPPFPGFATYAQMSALGHREGMYLATPDSAELKDLFTAIARKIKMQLVE